MVPICWQPCFIFAIILIKILFSQTVSNVSSKKPKPKRKQANVFISTSGQSATPMTSRKIKTMYFLSIFILLICFCFYGYFHCQG